MYDVVVCGGGLAGLTFALQLRRERPEVRLAVVEKQARPLPAACHKVGESSVELGSYYFGQVVGLAPYLAENHLFKNGLRFFCGPPGTPLWEKVEIGPSEKPVVPSYQMDRGTLEEHLRGLCDEARIELLEGWQVRELALGAPHRVAVEELGTGQTRTLEGRWLVDASGRRQLLARKLGLRRPSPLAASAAWFRIAGRLGPADLVPASEERWHARDVGKDRWLSTNHLTGPGYWVWLIPLSSGHTSVGIVVDHEVHDVRAFNQEERARAWLAAHEPEVAAALVDRPFEDFHVLKDYSYGSSGLFSAERWACVGEAGLFVDPLYSPGSDFIAMSNTFATELVANDLDGALDPEKVSELSRLYLAWAGDAFGMLGKNAHIFPHAEIFGAKMWWDFWHYWTFICQYYVQRLYRLPAKEHAAVREVGERYFELNERVQRLCEAWAELRSQGPTQARSFVPLPMFPSLLADAHLALGERRAPEVTLAAMRRELAVAERFMVELVYLALRGVGVERARELAERSGLSGWIHELDLAPLSVHDLPRRERKERLDRVARDLGRAVGVYAPGGAAVGELLAAAGA